MVAWQASGNTSLPFFLYREIAFNPTNPFKLALVCLAEFPSLFQKFDHGSQDPCLAFLEKALEYPHITVRQIAFQTLITRYEYLFFNSLVTPRENNKPLFLAYESQTRIQQPN